LFLLAINFLPDDVHSIAYFSLQRKHHMSFRRSYKKGLTNPPSTIYSLTRKRFLEILMAKLLRKRQQQVSDDALIFSQRVMHTNDEQVQNSESLSYPCDVVRQIYTRRPTVGLTHGGNRRWSIKRMMQ
jgi:hypothetical protein